MRDPLSTRQVWSRHGGFPGDGGYLEFHKIRFPGGLKFWRVTHPQADLGLKEPYEPNVARARAWSHAGHMHWMLRSHAMGPRAPGESVIVAPFDTELFGHWWHEGIEFVADLYRHFASRGGVETRTASGHLAARPPDRAIALATGSWGANGDFSMWLNPETRWTWERLWPLEDRFWSVARRRISEPAHGRVLAQAARELLLLQSSDWQFIITTGAAADYATRQFIGHAEDLERLLGALEREAAPSCPRPSRVKCSAGATMSFRDTSGARRRAPGGDDARGLLQARSVVIRAFLPAAARAVARAGGSGGQRRPVSRLESPD